MHKKKKDEMEEVIMNLTELHDKGIERYKEKIGNLERIQREDLESWNWRRKMPNLLSPSGFIIICLKILEFSNCLSSYSFIYNNRFYLYLTFQMNKKKNFKS